MNDVANWITPFTLIPGVGLLILSTVNRFHNVNNLIRGHKNSKHDATYINMLLRRSRFFHLALTSLYVSLAAFSIAALAGNLNHNWCSSEISLWVYAANTITTTGVSCVVFSAWMLIQESMLSYRMIQKHEQDIEKQ